MNSSSTSDAPAGTPSGAGGKIKLYLIGALVVLILGAVLYFVGLQSGKAQLAAQEAKFGVERNGLQSQVKTAETERDAAKDRAALMESRGALYRTAIDLDARNFGTANEQLQRAASALARVKGSEAQALQSEIAATDLNVAVDLADQRARVLGFAEQLNQQIPVEIESTTPTATASMPEDAQTAPSTP